MDVKVFWAYVELKKQALLSEHAERVALYRATQNINDLQGQPLDGKCILIASRANELLGIKAGAVVEASYRLGAQRIIEQTHEVATLAQIEAWYRLQEENAARTNAMAAARRAQQQNGPTITIAPPAPLQPRTGK